MVKEQRLEREREGGTTGKKLKRSKRSKNVKMRAVKG